MEVKQWSYEAFPEFSEPVEGAHILETTGDEQGIFYIHDVEYAQPDGIPLHLQILIPNSRNRPVAREGEQSFRLPCFVYVQGSAWFEQYMYGEVFQLGRMASKGYVCAIVQYRHSGQASFPAQIEDAETAIEFLKAHAKEYGIDPNRMILAGSSSGGHTAVWGGIRGAQVRGVVDYYGAVSAMNEDSFPTTENHHLPDSPEGRVMGQADMRAHPELRREMSAEENIGPDTPVPPTLILHGTKDRTVNTTGSVLLYKALKAAGKDAELCLLKGADHGGPEFWSEEVLQIVDAFCRRCFE